MRNLIVSGALFCAVAAAPASAATFDFTTLSGSPSAASATVSATDHPVEVEMTALVGFTLLGYTPGGEVTFNPGGLGVDSSSFFLNGNDNTGQVDGRGINEGVLFSFDQTLNVDSVSFSSVDPNDDFGLFALFEGDTDFTALNFFRDIPGGGVALFNTLIGVTDIAIVANGFRDNFQIAHVEVSAVPIPGAALLFGTALAGGAVMRRRRKNAPDA